MILVIRVRSTVWVGEMQLGERTGGVIGMISVISSEGGDIGG